MKWIGIAALLSTFSFLVIAQVADDSGGVTVTPEPTTIAVVAAGLVGVGVVAWRRNRKR